MRLLRRPATGIGRFFCRRRGARITDKLEQSIRAFHRCLNNVDFDMARNGELRVLRILAHFAPKCVFDVGANTGEWTGLLCNAIPSCCVHTFEPVPTTYQELLRQTRRFPGVVNNNFGLSAAESVIPIACGKSSSTATACRIRGLHYHDSYYDSVVPCKVRTASDYMEEQGIESVDFVKTDVEGMDLQVIKGFGEKITLVRALQFEYGVFNIGSHDLLADFWDYLTGHGFLVGKLFPRCVVFSDYRLDMENFYGSNYVAVRADHTDLIAQLRTRGR